MSAPMENTQIRILLVEDEPLWQEGIRALVSSVDSWSLVGIADHYEAAIEAFDRLSPDVILLDWKIKGLQDGLAVGQSILEKGFPASRIIIVSGSHSSLLPSHPFEYVPKQLIASELIETIQRVTKI